MRDYESSVEGSLGNIEHAEAFTVSGVDRWVIPLCVSICIVVAGGIAWIFS